MALYKNWPNWADKIDGHVAIPPPKARRPLGRILIFVKISCLAIFNEFTVCIYSLWTFFLLVHAQNNCVYCYLLIYVVVIL